MAPLVSPYRLCVVEMKNWPHEVRQGGAAGAENYVASARACA